MQAIADLTTYTTLYTFSTANMSLGRDFGRRESVTVIPGVDGVLDGYGRSPGPIERRDFPVSFMVRTTDGNIDRAYDLLAAAVAPGVPVQLVWQTDSGALWYTVGSNPRIQHTHDSEHKYGRGGTGGHLTFTVTWRIRPDWRPRYSEASDIWGQSDGIWGVNDGIWGQGFTTPLIPVATADPFLYATTLTIDATGIAGSTLPTLGDTGPVIDLTGNYGGDGIGGVAIFLVNATARVPMPTGQTDSTRLYLPRPVGFNSSYHLDCAAQRFTLDGVPFRPTKPNYQPWWFKIEPGKVNQIAVYAQGTSAGTRTPGVLRIDWFRKRA